MRENFLSWISVNEWCLAAEKTPKSHAHFQCGLKNKEKYNPTQKTDCMEMAGEEGKKKPAHHKAPLCLQFCKGQHTYFECRISSSLSVLLNAMDQKATDSFVSWPEQ